MTIKDTINEGHWKSRKVLKRNNKLIPNPIKVRPPINSCFQASHMISRNNNQGKAFGLFFRRDQKSFPYSSDPDNKAKINLDLIAPEKLNSAQLNQLHLLYAQLNINS